MAAKKWNLAALFCKKEVTFGVDPDADGSDYKHMKAFDMTFQPAADVVERPGLINDMTRQPHVMGAKGGTVAFKLEAKGSGTPGTGIVTNPEADELLSAVLGSVTHGTGTAVNDLAATTTSFTVDSAAGLAKYMMVLVDCGAPYGFHPRFITGIAGSVITLDRALPAAPADNAVVHATSMYRRTNSGHASMAFVAVRDGVEYTFLGCKLDSFKVVSVAARSIAAFEFSFTCSHWSKTTKASLPSTALGGVTATPPPVIMGSCFAFGGTEEHMYSLELDFGLDFQFMDSTCAQGSTVPDSVNAGMQLVNANTMGGTVKPYYEDSHMTTFAAGTEISVAFAAGRGAGNAWGFYAAKAQLGQPTMEEHNGFIGDSLPFMVNDNGSDAEYVVCLA